jgi:G3E family GTPase
MIQHMIEMQESSLRVVVIVNSISEVDMDGALLQQSDDTGSHGDNLGLKVIELNNSCICCCNEKEILKEVRQLADSCLYDYCIIEGAATVDLGSLTKILLECNSGNSSSRNYFIDSTIAVIDAVNCLLALKTRKDKENCTDIKIMESIMYNQIKVAELVVVNRCDQLSKSSPANSVNNNSDVVMIKSVLRQINPKAEIIESTHGNVDPSLFMNSYRFKSGMRESLDLPGVQLNDTGISTHTFRAHRPFHPKRFDTLMHEIEKSHIMGDSSSSKISRIKGYTWLANYPDNQGLLSYTKGMQDICMNM